jgi:hypothetical protein
MPQKSKPNRPSPKTKNRKAADPDQYQRFREFAREVEADDDPEAFDRRFREIVPPKPSTER